MITIIEFIFNISNLSIVDCFLTKPLILGFFFSIIVNAVLVAKLLILGILFSTVVNAVFVAKPLTSGVLSSISVILLL